MLWRRRFWRLRAPRGRLAQDMTFFITSVGLGNGGDLGGLDGADAHCQALAESAGAGDKTWRAYLGTEREGGRGIDARSRIGEGPWHNAGGDLIAEDLDQLHVSPNMFASTGLDESGNRVNARGDQPNKHDILTGSMADGTAYFPDDADHTCSNWTSSAKAAPRWGITTGTAAATRPGIRRTPPGVAPRRICRLPAGTGCFTASRQTRFPGRPGSAAGKRLAPTTVQGRPPPEGAGSVESAPVVGCPEVYFRAPRHDARGIDRFVTAVVMSLDVIEAHGFRDARLLIQVPRVGG